MRVLVVIPARHASTRFPGKPLALLAGKPIVQWVWERTSTIEGITAAVVATDDERIVRCVEGFGGNAMMTSSSHRSGTDRCAEVMETLREKGEEFDIVINMQGDEPFVQPNQIENLISCFNQEETQIATLRTPIRSEEELFSPNNVKVVCSIDGKALYFSRYPLPYMRGVEYCEWHRRHKYYKHVGIYAFRSETLRTLAKLPYGELEQCESLEQLRWLEQGFTIQLGMSDASNIGIDTPEDLREAEKQIKTLAL